MERAHRRPGQNASEHYTALAKSSQGKKSNLTTLSRQEQPSRPPSSGGTTRSIEHPFILVLPRPATLSHRFPAEPSRRRPVRLTSAGSPNGVARFASAPPRVGSGRASSGKSQPIADERGCGTRDGDGSGGGVSSARRAQVRRDRTSRRTCVPSPPKSYRRLLLGLGSFEEILAQLDQRGQSPARDGSHRFASPDEVGERRGAMVVKSDEVSAELICEKLLVTEL